MTREEMIESLVEDDLQTIAQEIMQYSKSEYLYNILEHGWKGYKQMTEEELVDEYQDRFDYREEEVASDG